jgi:hypothetical protein
VLIPYTVRKAFMRLRVDFGSLERSAFEKSFS